MITTSVFELFKIGPGPSSSHTVGPMRAMNDFREKLMSLFLPQDVSPLEIRVSLYGSLAATGHGHGTHRAILAGLFGEKPQSADTDRLKSFWTRPQESYLLQIGKMQIHFAEENIFFDYGPHPYRHSNTLKAELIQAHNVIYSRIYYSVGGGFIETDEDSDHQIQEKKLLPYPYKNMEELLALTSSETKDMAAILLENEKTLHNESEEAILNRLREIITVMRASVSRGLSRSGILPGGLNVERRAKEMYAKALGFEENNQMGRAMIARLNAYALAASEENADGNMVVTAPTNGAAGIIPACIEYLMRDNKIEEDKICRGLMVAAMVGFIIKDHASISGAELGCQAEVGSAASMAAALFSYCYDEDAGDIAISAEIALEHHLGMTCDPVMGLVQVPCIERNATGIIKAFNAYLLAADRPGKAIISFDQVVEVMRQTGLDLSAKYKETATGGLATHFGWGNMPGS